MSEFRLSAGAGCAFAFAALVGLTGCGSTTPCTTDADCNATNGEFCHHRVGAPPSEMGDCRVRLPNDKWACNFRCTAGGLSTTGVTDICVLAAGGQTEANTICSKKVQAVGWAMDNCGCAVWNANGNCDRPYLAATSIGATMRDQSTCQILTDDATRTGFVANLQPIPPSHHAAVTFNGKTVNVAPSGEVTFAIDQGHIRFNWMRTSLQDFILDGHNVTNVSLYNDGLPTTLLTPASSSFPPTARSFVFPALSFSAVSKADVDGVFISREVPLSQSMTGVVDLPSRLFRIAGTFTSPDGKIGIDMDLSYRIANLPPVADASATVTTVACTGNLHGTVHLDGTRSSDPDGASDLRSYTWFENVGGSRTEIATGAVADVSLPLGSHQIELVVGDSLDQRTAAPLVLTVENSTPPTLSVVATPSCLWPANHKMVLYRLGSEIQATAQSACDPSTTVVISSVRSNQPATLGGQGRTSPDVENGTSAACLRAERQGTRRSERVYTVEVTATDHQGNQTTRTVSVSVPHDFGHGNSCAPVDPALIVEDGDPRCTANLPAAAATPASTPVTLNDLPGADGEAPAGCGAAPGDFSVLALMMALLAWRRPRTAR